VLRLVLLAVAVGIYIGMYGIVVVAGVGDGGVAVDVCMYNVDGYVIGVGAVVGNVVFDVHVGVIG